MINKFFKTIHNKHSRFFRFIFFLRYLFGIFFIAISFFLLIPHFFNYENRAKVFKNYLAEDYDFKISRFEKIEFAALPLPKIQFKNVLVNAGQPAIEMEIKNLVIYPKLLNIYNYENFQSKKIKLKEIKISVDTSEINFLLQRLFDQKNKQNYSKCILKSKILKTNLKYDFTLKDDTLNIYNLYLRSKNLSLNNESKITFDPFFEIDSKTEIEDFNFKNFKKLDVEKIIEFKKILKKINFKNELIINPKKFSLNQIENFNLRTDIAYGRLNYSKNFIISNISSRCNGSINLLEEYPLLVFDCNISSKNKKNFFKKFGLKTNNENDVFNLKIIGNLNILSKKINLKKILFNENYEASKEDLSYFKETFENIVFDESFLEIFNYKKIKDFIKEFS